ncbi:MAG TPA: MFS transporter, partial [Candidatus Sulfomarinibacteraceae bacterium]|nr:MFS transporter [Candidatus Sulfomarinibacteraceae bacterium]
GSIGHIAAVTIATIAAAELAGSTALAGAPGAFVVGGAALGSALIGWLASRRGRREALVTGYGLGVVGAIVATGAVIVTSFPLLLVGTFFIGFGNSSNQASRYAAADLVASERRATAISTAVWAATVGAVVGPNLVPVAGGMMKSIGLPETAGAYLVPVVFVGAAALLTHVLLRPDPFEIAHESSRAAHDAAPSERIGAILRRPIVISALVALVVGQAVMTLIMTMTPLHMATHGHGLGAVGLVLSAHTLGMFAFAPASGRMTDRFGPIGVIFFGTAILALSSALAAIAPPAEEGLLLLAMFLLGWGWNLGFVAGSALLTSGVSLVERARVQGLTDALIWSAAAVASAGSGVVVATAGYATLGVLGVALVALPVLVLVTRRSRLADAVLRLGPTPIPNELDIAGEI